MAEQLKNMFLTESSMNEMGDTIKRFYSDFDKEKFLNLVFDSNWKDKALKERMRHTTLCLHKMLPKSYKETLGILRKAASFVKGFEAITLPDYVELYGMENWDLSLPALAHFTQYSSSEFAIRPFIIKNPERAMKFMLELADSETENVRRFSSEGCRPMLPWAMALPNLKKDPSLIFPILEKLKNDNSEFVRRSVANNLNDISKDNPEQVLDICKKWKGHTKKTDWIVKKACRTLLKAGNKQALILFGFTDPALIQVKNLNLTKTSICIGEELHFTFDLVATEEKKTKIRLEYAVYYMKAKGKLSKKIFQISENSYNKGTYSFKRKLSFIDMTTRKHYPGEHQISIIVNGEEKTKISLKLKEKN